MFRTRLQASGAVLAAFLAVSALTGCGGSTDPMDYDAIDPIVYSQHVQPILTSNCTTSACHNAADAAFDFSVDGYDDVARGSRFGSMVVPFEADRSHFYLHLTGLIEPRMPLGVDPLEDQEVRFLKRWIDEGARDDDGSIMYSDVTSKAFVPCQGENAVAVVDLERGTLARLLHVEAPHSVYVHQATRRLYVSRFETASDNIHVYNADTYELIATGQAGTFPALMEITPDGSQLWVTNFDVTASPDDFVRVLDSTTLVEIARFVLPNIRQPHGLAITADGSRVYVTNILSDNVSVFSTGIGAGGVPSVELFNPAQLPGTAARAVHQPQQCVLSSDESRLFVSALSSDKVYVMDTTFVPSGSMPVVAEVTVGDAPWHLTLSPDGTELWVADWVAQTISIVDVTNPDAPFLSETIANVVHPADDELPVLLRPIGIAFSPDGSQVYVTCANDDNQNSGHHPAPDGEKNPGNVVIFDRVSRTVVSVVEVPNFARFVAFLP